MLGKATRGEGFSLIEVVVALAVVALALAALWQGLNQAIVVTQEVPQRITALGRTESTGAAPSA